MDIFYYTWISVQLIIGFNLIFPLALYVFWRLKKINFLEHASTNSREFDYGIIVTAYEQVDTLSAVVNSILKMNYKNYVIYIVADNCDVSNIDFIDSRVILLQPPVILGSNIKSHLYAMENVIRNHDLITIIDSDNLVHPDYLNQLNLLFDAGFEAVQGVRKAKNLNTTIAALDAARDLYYHFYDGKLLFELGSSATLSGSGMAFERKMYHHFLVNNPVQGAGFDKVLQFWIIERNFRIGFAEHAIVYDEKTSKSDQLINQRSRWINTWFKYFGFGFKLIGRGIANMSKNQVIFGIVLLRPPLFIFLALSVTFMIFNIFISILGFTLWLLALLFFVLGFYFALLDSKADKKIYNALTSIPMFMYFQFISLTKARMANKRSLATKHYHSQDIDDIILRDDKDNSQRETKK